MPTSLNLNPIANYVKERQGKRVITKVLIANNGMAATKAILSMRRWTFVEFGSEQLITFIAMATQDDLNANAEFIRLADSFVEVPSGKNVNNYANVDLICKIAKEKGVDAVWPGWGHASENPKLPATLKEMGITFIGPDAGVMHALGDKIAANILAQTAKVPSIPWSGDGLTAQLNAAGTIPEEIFMKAMVNTVDDAIQRASKIGYPVMVKASEGGGGKGIRKAGNPEELKVAFTNVQTEVPGSPIFLMLMVSQARHLEVQILGDEYGNTLALNGRDCSTQRRFQKIFEEGPPIVAKPAVFREMEKSAMRLTSLVGYRGAGTVEYLYSAATDTYCFLELNPRLQVEHPVTEGITGVNLPATQLQIAMGIPLYNVPDIRRFYGLDPADVTPINFMETDYPPITSHVCASRITAENPDEGFKPTSGKIHSIRFQSSGDCWGYFSVGLKGGIHEFADSQFGHIFAKGKNREEARKSLRFALMNIDIAGDIRHPVDYLVDLVETNEYKNNTIDTSWLDRLIAEKLIKASVQSLDVVFFATIYRAFELVKKRCQEMVASMEKKQLVLLGKSDTDALISFPLEIVYEGKKFSFLVQRARIDTYVVVIGNARIAAKVRQQPDGSLYVSVGNTNQSLKGMEEALGLRLMIGATTVMVPTVYDPSELRSDVNGKIVRYLHDEGAEVAKGEAYVELEAMKMIMALKSSESGKISHTKSAGSIVAAGELLARLELKDPSKVQKIEPFEGEFKWGPAQDLVSNPEEDLSALLDGFEVGKKGPVLVEQMFQQFPNREGAEESVRGLLEKYLVNERPFATSISNKQPYDELLRELISEGKDSLEKVVAIMVAHNRLAERNEVVLATLREMFAAQGSGMSCMYVPDINVHEDIDSAVYSKIVQISQMPSTAGQAGDYCNVRYLAQQLLDVVPQESHEERVARFRGELEALAADASLEELPGVLLDGGLDLEPMVELLSVPDKQVQGLALRAYLRLLAAPSRVTSLTVKAGEPGPGQGSAAWAQHHPVPRSESHDRFGWITILRDISGLEAAVTESSLASLIEAESSYVAAESAGIPLNLLHIVLGRDAFPTVTDRTLFYNSDAEMNKVVKQCSEVFGRAAETLRKAGVGEICVVMPQPPRHPRVVIFNISADTEEWTEQVLGRDMWPSFVNLLELNRLKKTYLLERIHKEVRPTSHIYLGEPPSLGGGKASVPEIFMRGLLYSRITPSSFGATLADSLVVAMEEIEHAMLDPHVAKHGTTITSHVYLHFMSELEMGPDAIMSAFQETVNAHVGQQAATMLKLCVDEIEVKVRRVSVPGDSDGVETLRLSCSSLGGSFMKMRMLREFPDPITGNPTRWESATEEHPEQPGVSRSTTLSPALSTIQAKRVAARRAGSMYAYDLSGLLNIALTMKWVAATGNSAPTLSANPSDPRKRSSSPLGSRRNPSGEFRPSSKVGSRDLIAQGDGKPQVPEDLVKSVELVMDWTKLELEETTRAEGLNDIGMLAWRVTLRTPEYPEGRDLILIANDVTFQAGSFGVREDQFFQKASELARKKGLPRIYVSCNSGARVGLVEELKPIYKVQWIDENDPGKGFEYLYLTKADYEKLGPNVVKAHAVTDRGEQRYVLDAIIGEGQKSTRGGIGVENLQGSGLIAGETSRAYKETFTLSYITGRSVGIGAYLNRLGQRNIQMVSSPMILTGYSALNKLLGKNVYSSQDQLGGPQIMVPNGVTHLVVRDDQEGMSAILEWLSFVPKDAYSLPPIRDLTRDTWDREVEFVPTKQPYDPRDFLRGTITPDGTRLRGFFDTGSWVEYLEGWGRTVVVGRARLGGIPMGVIAVETRSVERYIPADPANPHSGEVVEPQAGQVWFPDSAFKTAQALRDFNNAENLPVMIFANWRGFSGGTRDMFGEILKYGAQIVDALVEYQHPIFIYIPPNGELRGGAWVVIDPAINPDKMEMYADEESRGGILEPPGVVEVKYKAPQQVEAMHRLDAKMLELDAKLATAEGAQKSEIEKAIKARERQLLPLYTSVAVTFADLHDRTGRMKVKGVIREGLEWKQSRRYFFWRVKRRLLQDFFIKQLQAADRRLSHEAAFAKVKQWAEEQQVDFNSDQATVSWLEKQDFGERAASCKTSYLKAEIEAMFSQLPEAERKNLLASMAKAPWV